MKNFPHQQHHGILIPMKISEKQNSILYNSSNFSQKSVSSSQNQPFVDWLIYQNFEIVCVE